MSEPLLTYYGDAERKRIRVERCEAHKKADRLLANTYGEEYYGKFQACAIGCQIWDIAQEKGVRFEDVDSDQRHSIVASDYGWPEWLCHLEDYIFEGLPEEQQADWPSRLVGAVPVGKNIEPIRHRLMAFIQRDMLPKYFDETKHADVAAAIDQTASLHERAASGDLVSEEEWSAARSAAQSAAQSAAWSAAWSAQSAARSAAQSAAQSAADSAARSAAQSAEWSSIADKLIELLGDR